MERVILTLLGGFRAQQGSGRTLALPGRKARALLAYLGLHPGLTRSRETLMAMLWGDVPADQARHSLRQTLVALRRALPNGKVPVLLVEGDSLALNPDRVEVDVATFEHLVKQGTRQTLEHAATLYQGELLAGLNVKEDPFEDWLRDQRERLRSVMLEVLTHLLAHQGRGADVESAMRVAQQLIALDPLREDAHRALMRLYERQGRRTAALRQYQICADILHREVGAEPELDTRRLHERLRVQPRLRGARRRAIAGAGRSVVDSVRVRTSRGSPATSSWDAKAPALVGRTAEIGRLRDALAGVRQGHLRAVIITGEAGVGKSRLVHELTRRHGGAVLTGHCHDMTQILAFGPWVEILRQGYERIAGHMSHGLSPVWRAELARLMPEISEEGLQPTSDSEDPLRLFEAVARLLADAAGERPLIVVLEDLHWADEMSLRLLAFLNRRLLPASVLLIGTVREEDLRDNAWARRALADLQREPSAVRLDLEPLDRADTTRLVRDLLDDRMALEVEPLAARVWETSAGNPFVIVETMRALAEGAPALHTGSALPRRVHDLIAGRLERLTRRDQHVLAIAAVAGGDVEFTLLQRASGLGETAATEAVEELVVRRILQRRDNRLTFGHDRIRDVVLDILGPLQRVPLHRTIARVLEDLHQRDLTSHFLALGTHYRAGQVWGRAAYYLRLAGSQAYSCWANLEAVACFEQAIASLDELPRSPEAVADGIELRLSIRSALVWLGEHRSVIKWLSDAEVMAPQGADATQLGYIHAYLAGSYMGLFDYPAAIDRAERALDIAGSTGDFSLDVDASMIAGRLCYYLGNYQRARHLLDRVVILLEDDHARELAGLPPRYGEHKRWVVARFGSAVVLSLARLFLCHTLGLLGDHTAARRVAQAMRNDSNTVEQTGVLGVMCSAYLLGYCHVSACEFVEAIPLLEEALATCRAHDAMRRTYLVPAAMMLAFAYARSGRTSDAEALLDETLECTVELRANAPRRIVYLSETCFWVGRGTEAKRIGQAELAFARERGERGYEALVLQSLGDIALRTEPPNFDEAEAYYRQSLTLAETLGMRPLQGRARLGLGQALRETDAQAAERYIQTAADLLTDLGLGRVYEANVEPCTVARRI